MVARRRLERHDFAGLTETLKQKHFFRFCGAASHAMLLSTKMRWTISARGRRGDESERSAIYKERHYPTDLIHNILSSSS